MPFWPWAQGKAPRTLRQRTSISLLLFMILPCAGGYLMWVSQDKIATASGQIRQKLLPTAQLIERAGTDLDLQIQELSLILSLGNEKDIAPHNTALLRLSPSVRTLLDLHESPFVPKILLPLLDSWAAAVYRYQEEISQSPDFGKAIMRLEDLRQKTGLIDRKIKREVSVQLLNLSASSRNYFTIWSLTFALGLLLLFFFVVLVYIWTRPLSLMRQWLETKNFKSWAPSSLKKTGWRAPPKEIQDLMQALRQHILDFQKQHEEIEHKETKALEMQRSVNLLFTSLQIQLRKNEDLLKELIKSEKLASMGEVSAQLAHEIRNPLNSMNLKLELLADSVAPEAEEILQKIRKEIDRLDLLTESYLQNTKAHLQEGETTICLNDKLMEILELYRLDFLGCEIITKISTTKKVYAALPENLLRSILLNLLKNAFEAITPEDEAKIWVELGSDKGFWTIEIKDRGCGFPEKLQRQPLRSFQTTKKSGSGLGLVTCQTMIEAYNGSLEIESPASRDSEDPSETFSTIVRLKAKLADPSVSISSGQPATKELHDSFG